MPLYMVERTIPGATLQSLDRLRQATSAACRASTAAGRPIVYLRSTFIPGESRCRCLFEAPDGELVRDVNDSAHLSYSRIVLAVELSPEVYTDRPP